MRLGISLAVFALFLVLDLRAFAGNEHEHLHYFPRFSDLVGGPEEKAVADLPAIDVLPENYREVIPCRFGEGVVSRKEYLRLLRGHTFREFSEEVSRRVPGSDPERIMQGFFELLPEHIDPKFSYMNAGSVRLHLFKRHPDLVYPSMVHALYSNHEFLNLKTIYTVPNEMLDPKLLKPIQKEFQNKNLQSQFYSSITRTALTQDAELEARLVAAKKGVEEGWLDGVDLVGSLHDDQMGPVDPTMIKNQLKKVFKASHDSALGVRIHAFESTSKGGFYDGLSAALWSCVREKCLPSELRVGHIQELEPKMIEAFENFRHVAPEMKLVFEVNLASNLQLVKGDLERLVSTIHDLHQRGMRVVIGSDGAGILGAKSRFDVAILKFQEVGMHGGSIDRLIEEAYTPLSHPPLAPGVPERWRHQMELVKKVVKVERVRARGENPSCNPSFLLKEINGNFPLDLDQ